jgi:hypothetical protein
MRQSVYKGQTVFSQIVDFLPIKKFRRCVDRYNGNYRVRSFTCFDQFLCMAFAQLTYRESLRDIECCLRAMREKLYHMGNRGKVSRSTIAYANENRDWRIYCDFAQILIHQARQLYLPLGTQGSNLLFQVISERHEKKSTMITTNLPFADWGNIFDSTTVATAIADRLVNNSEVLILEGASYRKRAKKN